MCFLGRNKQIGKANLKAYTYLKDEENQKDRRPYETEKDPFPFFFHHQNRCLFRKEERESDNQKDWEDT